MITSSIKQRLLLQAEDSEEFCGNEMRPFVSLSGTGIEEGLLSLGVPPAIPVFKEAFTAIQDLQIESTWQSVKKFFISRMS